MVGVAVFPKNVSICRLERAWAALFELFGYVAGLAEFRHDPVALVATDHGPDLRADVLVTGIHDEPCPVLANSQILCRADLNQAGALHRVALTHEALEGLTSLVEDFEHVQSVVHLPEQILISDGSLDLGHGETLHRWRAESLPAYLSGGAQSKQFGRRRCLVQAAQDAQDSFPLGIRQRDRGKFG